MNATTDQSDGRLVTIDVDGREVRIEHAWVGPANANATAPVIVFLHEGLGSQAMWKEFPARLCEAVRCRGLVYSRPGYGRSTPPLQERFDVGYMHREAEVVLPKLLQALGVREPCVLFGHSDGGSIALIHAAAFPERVAGAILLAPHIVVEAFGLSGIRDARAAYLDAGTGMKPKLARYHDDVDGVFWRWNDIWLSAPFEAWNIEALLPRIRCPVLAIQGVADPYGTMAQIDGIAARVPGTRLLKLPECGHSPHRDKADAVIAATHEFLTDTVHRRQAS